ncbi:MAG: NTP transferase domain-containing protein [Candidatus Omnitrophica bacterium]|nr:NTP transferase domain-containing protein [Candidatus Omnitrophota bacterium]MBU1932985.1 NTP transferase domain-containing protein [Candidatus Omnitrophota bacterium]
MAAIILAAGEGTRMKSSLPKVLHPVCGKPMLQYLVNTIRSAGIKKIVAVVGHKAGLVRDTLKDIKCVTQPELLGTGDAVLKAKTVLMKDKKINTVLVLCGDVCLVTTETLSAIIDRHVSTRAGCTLLTAYMKNPTGYGRIVRNSNNRIARIIEELDASIYEKVIEEINVGVYCFNKEILFECLGKIKPNQRKKEYYLTDIIELLAKSSIPVESVTSNDSEEFLGVNTREDLNKVEQVARRRALDKITLKGVTVIDPYNTYISEDVIIDKDTIIYPYTFIENDVTIGSNCSIGPFARLRPGTLIEDGVSIGNFVEIVRSRIGNSTKVHHQCYIGDTVIGRNVNIGAGTIVANYDGKNKHKTIIEDNAFIGTGTILVAPVRIGKGARTGAGSVVTKNHNVPAGKTVVGVPARILKIKKER